MPRNQSTTNIATPVREADRIVLLDSLRGFALLGILLMNIPYFGLPFPVADNPFVSNEVGTINGKTWYWVEMIPAGTQRALFSMLFGAGIILFVTKLLKRMEGTMPVEYFLRRQMYLIVFGLINAFVLLWPGDILFHYGIVGIIAFMFWRLKAKWLVVAAVISLLLMTARENVGLYRGKAETQRGLAVSKLDTTNVKLTEMQKDDLAAWEGNKEKGGLEAQRKDRDKELRNIRASYPRVYRSLSNTSAMVEFEYTYYGLWDILVFMFLGMAFFKSGVITGHSPTWLYAAFCVAGLALGLFLTNYELQQFLSAKGNYYELNKIKQISFHQVARVCRSLGIFGLLMLLYKSGWFKWLFALVRPVGRMAFTNYLTQSVVCGFFFYGFGLGRFGYLQRFELYYVVGTIWICQIIVSAIWLRYFLFGPMEWLWRCLTYWNWQPLLRKKEIPVTEPVSAALG